MPDEPVDFVVGGPDDDEPPAPAKSRRRRVELGVVALGLLVLLLIGHAAQHSDHQARPVTPTPAAPTGPVTPPPYMYKNNIPGATPSYPQPSR